MSHSLNDIEETPYPINKVGWGYSLLGGMVGGAIVGISFIFDYQGLELLLIFILASIVCGALLGLIPSAITGAWIINKKLRIKNIEDYCKLFLMGFLVSSIYAVLALILNQYLFEWFPSSNFTGQLLPITAGMGLLGGVSSIILGKILLPKVSVIDTAS